VAQPESKAVSAKDDDAAGDRDEPIASQDEQAVFTRQADRKRLSPSAGTRLANGMGSTKTRATIVQATPTNDAPILPVRNRSRAGHHVVRAQAFLIEKVSELGRPAREFISI